MQNATRLLRPLTLIMMASLISAPTSLGAQDEELSELDGEGLRYELIDSQEGAEGTIWEQYLFTFGPLAGLPEHPYPEAMVVKVMSGSFALRIGNEDVVVVDPQGSPIPILEPSGDPLLVIIGEIEIDEIVDGNGVCTTLCLLPAGVTVLIEEGATVYLPGNVTCLFCNISNDADATLMVVADVSTSDQPFSWTQLMDVGTPEALATPQADRSGQSSWEAISSGLYVGCR